MPDVYDSVRVRILLKLRGKKIWPQQKRNEKEMNYCNAKYNNNYAYGYI